MPTTNTVVLIPNTMTTMRTSFTTILTNNTTVPTTTAAIPTSITTIPISNTTMATGPGTKTTFPSATPTVTPSSTPYVKNKTYYEYEISMRVTEIKVSNENPDFELISTLVNECSDEYTKKEGVHYIRFQEYLKDQVCGIEEFKDEECELTITKLTCGSLVTDYKLVLGVQGSDPSGISEGKAGDVVKKEIETGLGGLTVDKTSFNYNTTKETTSPPTPTPEPPEQPVYVIVSMKYTWEEFCHVKELFKEKIAARSYDLQGKKLKPSDIYIVNDQKCKNADNSKTGIDVWIVALPGKDQDKVTIQIGEDLKELLDSRQLRKLGNHFENRVRSRSRIGNDDMVNDIWQIFKRQ
jgi:hypothetical protein